MSVECTRGKHGPPSELISWTKQGAALSSDLEMGQKEVTHFGNGVLRNGLNTPQLMGCIRRRPEPMKLNRSKEGISVIWSCHNLNLQLFSHGFDSNLDSSCLLQELWKFAFLRLNVGIATDVLVVDEDIWDGALMCHFLESVLDGSSIVYNPSVCALSPRRTHRHIPTWSSSRMYAFAPMSLKSCFVALQYGHQDLLKTAVVTSVRLSQTPSCNLMDYHTNSILVNYALSSRLCGGHGGWADARAEKAA